MNDEKLWKVFSLFIRLRDTDADGYGKCFTCRRIIHFRKGDCGHGIGRQHKGTKFDEKNNHLQCKLCNGFEGGRADQYKTKVNKLYGPQTWDLLLLKSKSVYKWSNFEIVHLEKYYQEQVNELMKKKNFQLGK